MATTYTMPSVPSNMQHGFGAHPYTPTSPTNMVMPYRAYGEERPSLSEPCHGLPYQARSSQSLYRRDYIHSPEIKRDPLPVGQLALPAVPEPRVKPAATEDAPKPFVGTTEVDKMMRAIQTQVEGENEDFEEEEEEEEEEEDDEEEDEEDALKDGLRSPPCSASGSRCSTPRSTKAKRRSKSGKEKRRCDWAGCKRTFTQGTHMRIHLRSHTGEKPYNCTWPSCNWTFSQHGNLKVGS